MDTTISKAFILGAGLGTRLRPLTERCPKPLVPICNRPLISYALDHLIAAGVGEFIINTHHCPQRYREQFGDGRYRGRRVGLRHEETLLDTGGGIRNVADFAGGEPLLVYNGDILTDLPLGPALDHHLRSGDAATLVLRSRDGPRQVAFDPESGLVRDIRGRLGRTGYPEFLFAGVYVVTPEMIGRIPAGVVSVVDTWLDLIESGELRIGGIVLDHGKWWDVGTLEQYLGVHRYLHNERYRMRYPVDAPWPPPQQAAGSRVSDSARLTGATFVAAGAVVEDDARLSDCVVWPDARVAAGSLLSGSVVVDGATAEGEARGGVFTPTTFKLDSSLREFIDQRARLQFPAWRRASLDVLQLDKGGSDRSFFVVRSPDGGSLVALHYVGEQAGENARYVAVARLLASIGVRAPLIHAHDVDNGLVWMEYLGADDLWSIRRAGRPASDALYRQTLAQLARLHARGLEALAELDGVDLHPPFDRCLYLWEQGYFIDRCLGPLFRVDETTLESLRQDAGMLAVADELAALPRVLVHRDCQSQNIMVHDGQTYLIDFQGARPGVALYDLASLLYDPYAELDAGERGAFFAGYADEAARLGVALPADVPRAFALCAAQRLMQALGAYGFLGLVKRRRSFLRHVAPAMRSLAAVAAGQPELAALDKAVRPLVE